MFKLGIALLSDAIIRCHGSVPDAGRSENACSCMRCTHMEEYIDTRCENRNLLDELLAPIIA